MNGEYIIEEEDIIEEEAIEEEDIEEEDIEEEEDITSDYRINPTTGQYEYVGGSMEDTMKEFRQKYPVDLRTNVGGTNQNYKTALGEGWATNYAGADTNNDFMPQNFNMALPIGSAEGGRIGLGLGSMSRRAFLKMMAAVAALPIVGKGITKVAPKAIPKVTETVVRGADGMPTYINDLIEVVKAKGTKDFIEGFKKSDYND